MNGYTTEKVNGVECFAGCERQAVRVGESRLILANAVNDFTLCDAALSVARAVRASDVSAVQEFWLAEPGDVLVTPRPLPVGFVEMACELLGIPDGSITTFSPNARAGESLPAALRRTGLIRIIQENLAGPMSMKLRACALDRPLIELASELRVVPEGYKQVPSSALIDKIYSINTKSGFRAAAAALGLRVAPGEVCESPDAAERVALSLLRNHDQVIVKCDRGSGGHGQFIVTQRIRTDGTERSKFFEYLEGVTRLGLVLVVEARLDLIMEPTIDAEITDDGVRHLYIGDMCSLNGAFQGMDVPARELPDAVTEDLRVSADMLGNYLFEIGYRGFFDIDAGVTVDGDLVLFEANVRRTSTSLWDAVLRRSRRNYESGLVWRLATRYFGAEGNFGGLRELLLKQVRAEGVSTIATWVSWGDEWWIRYLVVGDSWEEVDDLESRIEKLLC